MTASTFTATHPFDVSVEELFDWHERPGAFARLNPPWAPVSVASHQGGIRDGARVLLKVPLGPISLPWHLEHKNYLRPVRFEDHQISGPFSQYHHVHSFSPLPPTDGSSDRALLTDTVNFTLPCGALGRALTEQRFLSTFAALFRYRHRTTSLDLAQHKRFASHPRQHILVSGSSGLVGRALIPYLETAGHRISTLVRKKPLHKADELGTHQIAWDPLSGIQFPSLTGIDAVVHLAGEGIASSRWTAEKKRRIRDSRVNGTSNLCESLLALTPRPRTLICASAIGIYGSRGDELLTEESSQGEGFLAEVTSEWEKASDIARAAGIRVVHLRFGIILSPRGGALGRMRVPFSLGLGGPLSNGNQWMSWIGIDDVLGLIEQSLFDPRLEGPVNAVAPHPVTNAEFTATLAAVLNRPAPFRVPRLALRSAFGELADEALLASQRAVPQKALAAEYNFRDPSLRGALCHLFGKDPGVPPVQS